MRAQPVDRPVPSRSLSTPCSVACGFLDFVWQVSYAFVDLCVTGVLGVEPDAPSNAFATTLRLPSAVDWASAGGIPLGNFTLSVVQSRTNGTTVNVYGWRGGAEPPTLTWRAGVAGRHTHLMVNVDVVAATVTLQENDPNLPVSWVSVSLAVGQSVRVSPFQ